MIFEYLRSIAFHQPIQYKNEFNEILEVTNDILTQEWAQIDELIIKKLEFWHKIVEVFLFDLSPNNLKAFHINFRSLEMTSSAAYIELSLDLIEKIYKKLDFIDSSSDIPFLWSHFIDYFQDTFEHVINLTTRNE